MQTIRGGCVLLALIFLVGCGGNATSTSVWIDAPLNNITLNGTQPISIEGHASSPAGIAKIEITVNGELVKIINDLPIDGTLGEFQTVFNPPGPGEYTIEAIATSNDDEVSLPEMITFNITEAIAADTNEPEPPQTNDTSTLVPSSTEEPITEPLQVHFWADPAVVRAGNCTTLHWEVSNALDVVFAGASREFTGSEAVCQCVESTYPLTAISQEGVPEVFQVTVFVSGKCATSISPTIPPTRSPDTMGPSPPIQIKPNDNSSLGCTADIMLQWASSSDPSGILEYRIEVEHHPGDDNWQPVSGSIFTGIHSLEHQLAVECGDTYRWRIQAIDSERNFGDWSDWFTFTVIPN